MQSAVNTTTILIVEDDVVLGQVLNRILAHEGRTLVSACSVAEALRHAEKSPPRLALLDLALPDGDGVELADKLHSRYADLPVILITAYPQRLRDHPELANRFARVLIKPLNLPELRQAVNAALGQEAAAPTPFSALPAGESSLHFPEIPMISQAQPAALPDESSVPGSSWKLFKTAFLIVFVLGLFAGFAAAIGALRLPWGHGQAAAGPPAKPPALAVELVQDQPHTLSVPEEVRRALGIRKGGNDLIAVVGKPMHSLALEMSGSTALDPTRLYRIRARFAPSPSSAEVVQIGQVAELPGQPKETQTVLREIRSGDWVHKGDILAVFHSVDVGNKKNDLIDAIYQLKLDEEILVKAEAKADVVPDVFLWNAERNVRGDINNIKRILSTLETWGISEQDIQAVRIEAEEVKKRRGKRDLEKDALWARVEIRSPDDGVIVERNLSLHEIVVDNTTNLFQIAKVDRLVVFAHVPEDELPALERLPLNLRQWTVKTTGSDPLPGPIDDIGYLIDPNQHTAIVKGHIENKDGKLRAGQFVTATVELPAPPDVVEVPTSAVIDDGQQCVVFVQTDPVRHHYKLRRVEVEQRFDKTVFVRSKPFGKGEQLTADEEKLGLLPKEPLRPNERILLTGVGELKAALLDKEAVPNQERENVAEK
jgi:cobalt-zinc-cadmium efflux system membrane fusion protein